MENGLFEERKVDLCLYLLAWPAMLEWVCFMSRDLPVPVLLLSLTREINAVRVDEVLPSSDADRFWNCHDKGLTSLWLPQHRDERTTVRV